MWLPHRPPAVADPYREVSARCCAEPRRQDNTPRVLGQRKTFVAVKQRLQGYTLKYGLLFLVKLRVQYGGSVMFFYTPAEANDWLCTLRQHTAGAPIQLGRSKLQN
ncbi:hypothetical protein NDU88_001463 [Pleurodeles waltl]|uniref:PH domain-containing protein n=1 Tax=Pleurodeles waltl TaxID=8319 RepID=A0AAV7UU39_PLEWA|nr:hypothetical protein NDU88_001463 [Pleurodeles waltl]